ncbi:hypothetical protein Vi05172_g8136 [Venturia inaequalis]|nr:hypothetical protein Vi05172_g8136 [Venturia inaequalis]
MNFKPSYLILVLSTFAITASACYGEKYLCDPYCPHQCVKEPIAGRWCCP